MITDYQFQIVVNQKYDSVEISYDEWKRPYNIFVPIEE